MKKLLFLLALVYSCSFGQGLHICQLPSTSIGSVNDWLIKQDSSCVNGTKKIKVTDFITHYLGTSGGLPAVPLNSLQYNSAGAFGGAKIGYTETSTNPVFVIDTLKEFTIRDAASTQAFIMGPSYVNIGTIGFSSILFQGSDMTLFSDSAPIFNSNTNKYKFVGPSTKYGTLDYTGITNHRNYQFHDASGHLELSEGIPITIADLQAGITAQTLPDAKYILLDGSNPDLVVTITDGQILPKASISSFTPSQAGISVGDNTGLAGRINVVDGTDVLNSSPIVFDGDMETAEQIASNIAAQIDLLGYSAFTIGGQVYINSPTSTNGGVLTIATVSGDDLVATPSDFAVGSAYSLEVDYKVRNDFIRWKYDNVGNKVYFNVDGFKYCNTSWFGNSNVRGDFTGSDLANFSRNTFLGNGGIVATGSNAFVQSNTIGGGTLDIASLFGGENFIGNSINVGEGTFTPNKGMEYKNVNLINSDYENDVDLSVLTDIDFNTDASTQWTGVWNVAQGGQLNSFSSLARAPKYFEVRPSAGQTLDLDVGDATNIKLGYGVSTITAIGDSGDVVYFYNDGSTAYVVNSKADICHSKIKADTIEACSPLVLSGTSVTFPSNQSAALLATNSDGTIANQTKAGLLGYKSYIATITQTGTGTPTATVSSNDLGSAITWARTSAGLYTASSSASFTANKTAVFISSPTTGLIAYSYVNTSTSVITFTTSLNSVIATVLTAVPTDVLLTNVIVEIRVLN